MPSLPPPLSPPLIISGTCHFGFWLVAFTLAWLNSLVLNPKHYSKFQINTVILLCWIASRSGGV